MDQIIQLFIAPIQEDIIIISILKYFLSVLISIHFAQLASGELGKWWKKYFPIIELFFHFSLFSWSLNFHNVASQ